MPVDGVELGPEQVALEVEGGDGAGLELGGGAVGEHGFEIGRKSLGDVGYFQLAVRTPDLRDGAAFTPLRLPAEVEARLASSAPVLGG